MSICIGRRAFVSLFMLLSEVPVMGSTFTWRPVIAGELAKSKSTIEPAADAEILFRDVRMDKLVTTTYIRVKIFNNRGRDIYSNVKIEYVDKGRLSGVEGRTIHTDGTIIDVKPFDMFDAVEAKGRGFKVKVLAFALPAVEAGSVIEYRWSEKQMDEYNPLVVQADIPTVEATYHLKPAFESDSRLVLGLLRFGCQPEVSEADKGFTTLTMRNVPSYHDEPFSPPEQASRQWILAFYEYFPFAAQMDYWAYIGKQEFEITREIVKSNSELRKIAAEVAKGASDEEKLASIAAYCQKTITNVSREDVTTEQLETFKQNKNAADALRRQKGTALDIHLAFIALARAAGYDARLARIAGRRSFLFDPSDKSRFFLRNYDAAVLVKGAWKFYDVTDTTLPFGTLSWYEQGCHALIPDPDTAVWEKTPLLTAEESRVDRIANLTLTEEGDLEGEIREIYWGNKSSAWRTAHAQETDAERLESVQSQLRERFANSEISDLKVTASPNARLPVGMRYHLLLRHYAQRTGKRLFLCPDIFTCGSKAYFSSDERQNSIYFDFPWSENDQIDLHVPKGFQAEQSGSAAPFSFAPLGKYTVSTTINIADNSIHYGRAFVFGSNQAIKFDRAAYPAMKTLFDRVQKSDGQLVTLIQSPIEAKH